MSTYRKPHIPKMTDRVTAPKSEFPFVVHIFRRVDEEGKPELIGTGTFITPCAILTAAHIFFYEDKSRSENPDNLRIEVVQEGDQLSTHSIAGAQLLCCSSYHADDKDRPIRNDAAIILLKSSLDGVSCVELCDDDSGLIDDRTTSTLVGQVAKIEGPRIVCTCPNTYLRRFSCTDGHGSEAEPNILLTNANTCSGDSGGAILFDHVQIGIHSSREDNMPPESDPQYPYSRRATRIAHPEIQSWIRRTLEQYEHQLDTKGQKGAAVVCDSLRWRAVVSV